MAARVFAPRVRAPDICSVGVGSELSFQEKDRDCVLVQLQASQT